jgi:molybdopterin molybdotransferase
MKEFFKVTPVHKVIEFSERFPVLTTEEVSLVESYGRILARDVSSDIDIPDFQRSTVDGYAVCASSTFGASEGNPAFLTLKGSVAMGEMPSFSIQTGEAAQISTGGMLPNGSDAVVMIEHTQLIDETSIEVYRSIAPGLNMIETGEDLKKNETILKQGMKLRAQECGLLAAMGIQSVPVYKRPVIAIISTGDEIVPSDEIPGSGQIRDVNSYTLSSLVKDAGGMPILYGIVKDNYDALNKTALIALSQADMILLSGGSSVGTRDFTIQVLSSLDDSEILVHGISISPGKPTILAKVQNKSFWGLPGHVVSAMIVFNVIVKSFIEHISGFKQEHRLNWKLPAILTRNISSAQGRTDYIRVKLNLTDQGLTAEPILGKSGLIRTMIKADGIIEIDANIEGLYKGTPVEVILI